VNPAAQFCEIYTTKPGGAGAGGAAGGQKLPKPLMKLQGMTNVECRLTNGGIASLSLFKIDRIHYFDIRYSLFQSFFLDLTGRFFGQRRRLYETPKVSPLTLRFRRDRRQVSVSVQVSGYSVLTPSHLKGKRPDEIVEQLRGKPDD